jgi:hypothetical protein
MHVSRSKTPVINFVHTHPIFRVSQEECARLRENVPKVNGYGDNGERNLKV